MKKHEMKVDFSTQSMNSHNMPEPVESTYTVPLAGFYSKRATITIAVATGKFEIVKNPARKFFQFWKPKFIKREIFEYKEGLGGFETVYLEKGESLKLNSSLYRLGDSNG